MQKFIKITQRIVVVLGLFLPSLLYADVVDISLKPDMPTPNESVSAQLVSSLIDLDRSKIYWYVNDEIQKQGIGASSFSFTTGSVDEKTVLDAIIITPEGRRIDLQKIIEPTGVDLLWEADTYTPPFYRGKALPTYKSPIKVVAVPINKDPDTKFIYTWSIGKFGTVGGASGYNKIKFITFGSYADYERDVNVEITSFDGSKYAKKHIKIKSVEPEVVLYRNKPLAGINFNTALFRDQEVIENEFCILAEPFFVTKGDVKNNSVEYYWTVGKDFIENEDNRNRSLNFVKPKDGSGKSLLQIFIKNTANTYHRAGTKLLLTY